jgi:acyl-CoA reductase-like NAD-dependent aldehyde dehydrogenase
MPISKMTINGESVLSRESFEVINPATGVPFAQAPDCTAEQLEEAMCGAEAALPGWRSDDGMRRKALCAAADVLAGAAEPLSSILTSEQGKPLADARAEIAISELWLRYFADLELPPEVIQDDAAGYAEIIRRPLGVVGAITPWNFPIVLAFWKLAPALRAGNTVVLKPSPFTPLTTLAIGELFQGVLPPGVLNVVSGEEPLGSRIIQHRAPRKITFTGSTATGKRVMAAAAAGLKRVTLELGGNDPAIVLDDIDPDAIAASLFDFAFVNNGQTCVAVKRVYVHERIYPGLVDAMAARAAAVQVGEGTEAGVELGPLNNRPQFDRVSELVAQALNSGARAAAGGGPLDRPGYFFRPTILVDVDDGMQIVAEEQFGPALPILSYRSIEDAVTRANDSPYGLTASVWSSDPDRAAAVGRSLDCGQVSFNSHASGLLPHLPFGGSKWSGIGVENGSWGLNEFTQLQVMHALAPADAQAAPDARQWVRPK